MNANSSPLGSIWRKWDLHFHTPTSYDYAYKSATNEEIIAGLIKAGIEVVAITDHHRIEPARIKELQRLGGSKVTVLPGIEIRSELGGSESVHFIGIFPETIDVADLWQKLSGKLDITEADVAKKGNDNIYCPFVATCEIIHELGGIASVHAGRKSNSIEELKNSDYIKRIVKKDLVRRCIDIYEVGSANDIPGYIEKVFPHLDRPLPLILCSDNHDIRDYTPKCSLWVKGDKTFEALRQTLFEPFRRIAVKPDKPIAPLLTIRTLKMDFPDNTNLVNESEDGRRTDQFCFRGQTEITFSPYLTCIIGGRGSGKSTLLNLIHEKLEPEKNKFFSQNSLEPQPSTLIAKCVSIDGDTEQKVVEFLQQNEIEQFATTPSRFTEAVFSRLRKLDADGILAAVESEFVPAMIETNTQGQRLKEHYSLNAKIIEEEKELAAKKTLVASFQNEEYKKISVEMGSLNRELQGLRNWRLRLEGLIKELLLLQSKLNVPSSENPNAYEKEFFGIRASIDKISISLQERPQLEEARARESELDRKVAALKYEMDVFLKGRGLSSENLADVGKANERIAQIEQEMPALKAHATALSAQIAAFTNKRALAQKYADAVTKLLAPLNETLSNLSKEVKPIELRYEFDVDECWQTLIEHIKDSLGEDSPRIDHLESMLDDVNFLDLTTREAFIAKIPEGQKTAKELRDYFSNDLNFALLCNEVERQLLDVGSYERIRVSYDGKPVENSSFGQRCTAAIVILLLLGNTPIVIDEPEAHLDSALIANYLVELVKKVKVDRQIIFATHNANFVINGDAELIHVLEMAIDRTSKIESITIENLEHRDKLLALEGGQDAFLKRECRYGIG